MPEHIAPLPLHKLEPMGAFGTYFRGEGWHCSCMGYLSCTNEVPQKVCLETKGLKALSKPVSAPQIQVEADSAASMKLLAITIARRLT